MNMGGKPVIKLLSSNKFRSTVDKLSSTVDKTWSTVDKLSSTVDKLSSSVDNSWLTENKLSPTGIIHINWY